MSLHPTYEDRAHWHKRGSKDEDLEQVETTSVQVPPPAPDPSLYRPDVDTSAIDPRKLKRKIDFRLVPWLALLYLMNFLDRGSIGNARVCPSLPAILSSTMTQAHLSYSCTACRRTCTSQISSISRPSQSFSSPMLCSRCVQVPSSACGTDSAY